MCTPCMNVDLLGVVLCTFGTEVSMDTSQFDVESRIETGTVWRILVVDADFLRGRLEKGLMCLWTC